MARAVSNSTRMENSFLSPLTGLIRVKSIFTGSNERIGPVCIMLPTIAASMMAAKKGAASVNAERNARSISGQRPTPEGSIRPACIKSAWSKRNWLATAPKPRHVR